jgi:hypothetical protein
MKALRSPTAASRRLVILLIAWIGLATSNAAEPIRVLLFVGGHDFQTNQYRAARVACIQLGHDRFAYENPHYRQLVAQAIRWTAKSR